MEATEAAAAPPAAARGGAPLRRGAAPRAAAGGAAAAVLIVLVVVASRPSAGSTDAARANPGPVIAIAHAIQIVGIAVELVAVVLFFVLLRLRRRRREEDDEPYYEPPRLHWAVRLLIAALPPLLVAGTVVALYRLRAAEPTPLQDRFGGPPPPLDAPAAGQASAALALAWWEYAVAVAIAAAAIAFVVRALRPAVGPLAREPERPPRARTLARAVSAGLHDAERERDPRRAVVAAYASMEQTLAAHGLPRREAEAPLEYVERLFAELAVDGEALRTLTDLFELARFSHHEIAPAMKDQAIAALSALRQGLRGAP